jgi:O-antigen ligase
VTFDRVWVLAALSLVFFTRRQAPVAGATRLLLFLFGLLAVTYGLRAMTTTGPHLGYDAKLLWLDVVVVPLILFAAAAKLVVTRDETLRIAGAIAIGGVLLACIGLAEKVANFELATRAGGSVRDDGGLLRISGPYPAPEPYALALLIALAATLYWVQARRAYLIGSIAIGLEALAIGFTYFRTAWICGVLVVAISLMRPGRHARTIIILAYIALIAGLAFGVLESSRQFSARVHNTQNINARLATYDQAISIFRSKPLYGVGIDQYVNVASQLPATAVNGVASVDYPHDSYLGVLAETGIVGLAPLLAATIAVWLVLKRMRRRMTTGTDAMLATSVTAAALAYFLMSLPLYMFTYGMSNAAFALLLGVACGRLGAAEGERGRTSEAGAA